MSEYEKQLKVADEALRKAHILAPKEPGLDYRGFAEPFFVNARSYVEQLIADCGVRSEEGGES